METRKIKSIGYKVNQLTSFLHPNTAQFVINTTNHITIPTKSHVINDNNNYVLQTSIVNSNYQNEKISKYEVKKFMLYPSVVINSDTLLILNNINSFDDLYDKVNYLLANNYNYDFINRIINSWIRNNFDDLKKNNSILVKLYLNFFNGFKINVSDEKIIETNINKWFAKHSSSDFHLNLANSLKKKISK